MVLQAELGSLNFALKSMGLFEAKVWQISILVIQSPRESLFQDFRFQAKMQIPQSSEDMSPVQVAYIQL